MRSIKIFPDPVWKGTFPGRIDKILSKADNFKSDKNVTTKKLAGHTQKYNTKDYPHDWPELDEFNQWFSKGFQTVWQDWDLKLEPYQDLRFKSWINYNSKNDYLLEHTHPNDVMTVVFYLQKKKNTGNLQVLNPMMYHWQNNPDTKFWKTIPAETSDVIIIPGWMMHKVEINDSDEERISMTINVQIIHKEK